MGGVREKNPPLASRARKGAGGERLRVPLPERRWVEEVGAGEGGGTRAPGPRRAMASERTRRFTRSLLRPGQAAELRHSAASAAAVAVSSRQQQRVSAARPPRLPVRPGLLGARARPPGALGAPFPAAPGSAAPARPPPPPLPGPPAPPPRGSGNDA